MRNLGLVNRHAVRPQLDDPSDGLAPLLFRLAHETAHQVEIHAAEICLPDQRVSARDILSEMHPAVELEQFVVETLHAHAHAGDAHFPQRFQELTAYRSRRALECDFLNAVPRQRTAQSVSQAVNLSGAERGRRAAAEIRKGDRPAFHAGLCDVKLHLPQHRIKVAKGDGHRVRSVRRARVLRGLRAERELALSPKPRTADRLRRNSFPPRVHQSVLRALAHLRVRWRSCRC